MQISRVRDLLLVAMNGTTGVGGGNGGGNAFQARIDELLELVTARSRGEVGTQTVEDAVAQLLSDTISGPSSSSGAAAAAAGAATRADGAAPAPAPAPVARAATDSKVVVEDDDDYDNIEEGCVTKPAYFSSRANSGKKGKRGTKRPSSSIASPESTDTEADTDEDYVASDRSNDDDYDDGSKIDQSKRYDELDAIPLGRVGAKMMVTFGDGRNPRPKAVEAALLVSSNCTLRHKMFE